MQCFAHRVFGCFEVPAQWQYTGQTSAEVSAGKICFQFSAQFVVNGFKHIKIFPSGLKHILFNRIFCLFSAVTVVLKYDTDTNLSTILHACQEVIGNIFSHFRYILHYWKASSLFAAAVRLYVISDKAALITKITIPMTEAMLYLGFWSVVKRYSQVTNRSVDCACEPLP